MTEEAHPLEQRVINHLKAAARNKYSCPYCSDGFAQERRLWEHAKKLHSDDLDLSNAIDEGQLRKDLELKAAYVKRDFLNPSFLCSQHPSFTYPSNSIEHS